MASHGKYLFSDFSFDSNSGELARNGHRLRITEQARQILTTLLENADRAVTREELRQRLWPGGEFLDWDRSINKVVAQLRSALHDNPKDTKFIETIPKRGYRFTASVVFEPMSVPPMPECVDEEDTAAHDSGEAQQIPAQTGVNQPLSLPYAVSAQDSGVKQHHRIPLRRVAAWSAILAIVGIIATLTILHLGKREPSPSYSNIGIPPFETAGDGSESLAESFRMDLTNAVAELPTVQVRAEHSFSAPLRDDQSIRAAAKSLQLDLLLLGKMTRNGDAFVLNLELVRDRDAVHLASFHYSGSTQELGSVRERIQRDLFAELGLARLGQWRARASTPN